MIKYTYDWFVERSKAAQRSVDQWPQEMKDNIAIAAATLPRLGEDRSQAESVSAGQETGDPAKKTNLG